VERRRSQKIRKGEGRRREERREGKGSKAEGKRRKKRTNDREVERVIIGESRR